MNKNHAFRPPAIPLVTHDPYFSIWAAGDTLYGQDTVHWTGASHPLIGTIEIDGSPRLFLGQVKGANVLTQTGLIVDPLSTTCAFEGLGIRLETRFTSPLLPDDLDMVSRPVSYISFAVVSLDGHDHQVRILLAASPLISVDSGDQEVSWEREDGPGYHAVKTGSVTQDVLGRDGDDLRIDWGHLYLAVPEDQSCSLGIISANSVYQWIRRGADFPTTAHEPSPLPAVEAPLLSAVFTLNAGISETESSRCFAALAFDDVLSMEYFGERLPAYWRREAVSFPEMLASSVADYRQIMTAVDDLNERVNADALGAGGPAYRDLCALAFRQSIAAHKLAQKSDGTILFLSKECFSNGCMGTVDVSYPSIPLYLWLNPELVKGMLNQIFEFAESDLWPFDYAPHDIGRYPIGNGQVYGLLPDDTYSPEKQMPVEECGNMLIMTAAVARAEGSALLAEVHWEVLEQWHDYLTANGMDPGNQLCTDDFAGHLAHNTNLAVKAILGIASFGLLCGLRGDTARETEILVEARAMAEDWAKRARDTEGQEHYRLAFDQPGTWSMKYNLVWDRIFGLELFPDSVFEQELDWYKNRQQEYGLPLDSRSLYTKSDWLVWCASLARDKEEFIKLIDPLWKAMNESSSRVPFTDWYFTDTAVQRGFQNRTVVGGIFIRFLLGS